MLSPTEFHQLQRLQFLQQFYTMPPSYPLLAPMQYAMQKPQFAAATATPPFSPSKLSPHNTMEFPHSARALEAMSTAQFRRLAGHEGGRRFLQQQLAQCEEYRAAIFAQALKPGTFVDLAKNHNGNYVAQDLLSIAGERIYVICEELREEWLRLAFHKYGTRVVQRAIEVCPLEEVYAIAGVFRGLELAAAKSEYACHVVQKLIDTQPLELFRNFVHVLIAEDVLMDVVTHQFGCHVALKLLSRLAHFHSLDPSGYHTESDQLLLRLATPIVDKCRELAEHEYGNFLVQYLVKCRDAPELRIETVRRCVTGRVLALAQSKFGSHVVEKAVLSACESEFNDVCRELIEGYEPTVDGRDALDIVLFDQYGNYVAQTILRICFEMRVGIRPGNAVYLPQLEAKIRGVQPALLRYSSGKKIIDQLDQMQSQCGRSPKNARKQQQQRVDLPELSSLVGLWD